MLHLVDIYLGAETYNRIRLFYYPGASVVIICFALDDPISLRNVEELWAPEVRAGTEDPTPSIMLVGCKADIRSDPKKPGIMEESEPTGYISADQGREMARRVGASIYLECSAKTGEGVEEVFHHAARLSLRAGSPF
ncbi:GTP-binding protein Rho1 [Serendipita sp. 399]|nr:GTP-binding protein Rho1 [Serendipita sp. 399]